MVRLWLNRNQDFIYGVGGLLSIIAIFFVAWWCNGILYRYDWGPLPVAKISAFALLIWMAVGVGKIRPAIDDRHIWRVFRAAVSGLVLAIALCTIAPNYFGRFEWTPTNDIGMTTLDCTGMVWQGSVSPYANDNINPRSEIPRGYRGYHYGPGMFLLYAGAGLGKVGYQVCLLIWFAILVSAGIWLAAKRESTWLGRIEAGLFFCAVVALSRYIWREYFEAGVNDGAPLALLLISLLLVGGRAWVWAGFFLGLSFSAKFAPAVFLLIALVRKGVPSKFWVAAMAGMFPLVWAFVTEPAGAFRNIFLSRFHVGVSHTSFLSMIPEDTRYVVSAVAMVILIMIVSRGWNAGTNIPEVLRTFLLVACVGLLSHREFHANHITWVIVTSAILLTYGRVNFWTWVAGWGGANKQPAVSSGEKPADAAIEQSCRSRV